MAKRQKEKDIILDHINDKSYVATGVRELLALLFGDDYKNDASPYLSVISSLEREFLIAVKRGKVLPPEAAGIYHAIFRSTSRDYGFASFEGYDDAIIRSAAQYGVMDGDEILIKTERASNGGTEAFIIKILKRKHAELTAVIDTENGQWFARPEKGKNSTKIQIDRKDLKNAVAGNIVHIAIIEGASEQPGRKNKNDRKKQRPAANDAKIRGKVLKVLGDRDNILSNVERVLLDYNIRSYFDHSVIFEADNAAKSGILVSSDRVDLREKLIFSIDGADAKDLDDAISLETDPAGNYVLGVHIADVSSYVTPGSECDKEAYLRGTSVYFVDRVIPMLPRSLSNGICSLNVAEDRLTISATMTINPSGKIISSKIEKTLINSKVRGVYEEVNALWSVDCTPERRIQLEKKYSPVLAELTEMRKLAKILYSRKISRGALEFVSTESLFEIEYDENKQPTVKRVYCADSGESEGMIEEFMLSANEAVAAFLLSIDAPCLYRIHEDPFDEKLDNFAKTAMKLGYNVKGLADRPIHIKTLQKILDLSKKDGKFEVINTLMLRSLSKAKYSTSCSGHFGLALREYCHFTSPIRRYPDLFVHRMLKLVIEGKMNEGQVRLGETFAREAAPKNSEREVAADMTERDIDDLYKCAYMSSHIGEEFDGKISSVTSFGLFVKLPNTCEGLIRLSDMNGYFEFDSNSAELRSNDKCYSLGMSVKIIVAAANISRREVDFVFAGGN